MSTFDDRFLNVSTSQPQPDDKHFNRDKDPSPVLTAERAVAEAEARPRPFGIPPEEMAELNVARRSHLMNARADGIMAVMLVGRAGWTPQSAAAFLGMEFKGVQEWCETYQIGTLEDLRRLDPPGYLPIPPAEKA